MTTPETAMKDYQSVDESPQMSKSDSKQADMPMIVQEEGSFVSGPKDPEAPRGSSIIGASLNFTNVIVGAGCVGIGGAIANSGGIVSILSLCFFAYLSKLSYDLVLELAVLEDDSYYSSYEGLGVAAFGKIGRDIVIWSKGLNSYGCLVAYIVIVRDNFAPAATHLLFGSSDGGGEGLVGTLLRNENFMTTLMCATIMLPLCMLRDMHPFEKFAAIKIITVSFLVAIVAYLFAVLPKEATTQEGDFYTRWIEVKGGLVQSLGTFVFTFVAQHTVHMVYKSLKPELRTVGHWKEVSTLSIILSTGLSLMVGLFVYITFWGHTTSNMFELYPSSQPLVHAARLLLCIMMVLTYPAPFFACREMLILGIPHHRSTDSSEEADETTILVDKPKETEPHPWYLLPGEERQLIRSLHVLLTTTLWASSVYLALAAPSLGDVLNLLGCTTSTIISFLLPGMFSFKIRGYTHDAALILIAGGFVGIYGTYLSMVQLVEDAIDASHHSA